MSVPLGADFAHSVGEMEPVPVDEQSKACVCGRSLAGIAGSNPAGGMYVCCECCVCCQVEVSATG